MALGEDAPAQTDDFTYYPEPLFIRPINLNSKRPAGVASNDLASSKVVLKDEKLKLSHPTLTKPIGSYKKAEMAKNDQMISPKEKLK